MADPTVKDFRQVTEDWREMYTHATEIVYSPEDKMVGIENGEERPTLTRAFNRRMAEFLAETGYNYLGDYEAGLVVTDYFQLVRDVGSRNFWRLDPAVDTPYTTTGAGMPEGGNFILVENENAFGGQSNQTSFPTVLDMVASTGNEQGGIAYVADPVRGGVFQYTATADAPEDGGVRFNSGQGQWIRLRENPAAANVDWYEGTDAERVQACMDSNHTVNFTTGQTYRLDKEMLSSGKSIRLNFNDCQIVQTAANSGNCFSLFGGWGDVVDITDVNYNPDAGVPYVYSASPLGAERGDIVKLASRTTYGAFQTMTNGEFKEVYSGDEGDGNKVLFNGKMRYSYEAGTAQIAKLSNAKIEVYGPVSMEQERGFTDSDEQDFGNMIRVGSAREPVVSNVRVAMCYQSAVCLWSCYNARVDDFTIAFAANFQDGRDFDGSGYIGYGIRDCNSTATAVHNLYAQSSRHGYVAIGSSRDDGGPVPGLSGVGPNMHARVYDSMCVGCSNAGFDTHHGQEHTYFFNCISRDGMKSGYQARGLHTEFHNCVSERDYDCMMAFIQSNYTDGRGRTDYTVWKGGRVIDPRNRIFRINENSQNTLITDVSFEFTGDNDQLGDLFEVNSGASLTVNNVFLNALGKLSGISSVFYLLSSNIDLYVDGFKGFCPYQKEFSANYFVDNSGSNVTFINNVRIWRANFRNMFKTGPNGGGEISHIRLNIAEEIVRGTSNASLGNNFMGPIHVSRTNSHGRYS